MDYKKILATFANKREDKPVIQAALDMAAKFEAKIDVLHINSKSAGAPSRAFQRIEHKYTVEELREVVDSVNDKNLEYGVINLKSNDIVEEIVEHAKDYDLLVMGHEDVNFFEAMVSDSIGEKVINQIKCDCLVITTN